MDGRASARSQIVCALPQRWSASDSGSNATKETLGPKVPAGPPGNSGTLHASPPISSGKHSHIPYMRALGDLYSQAESFLLGCGILVCHSVIVLASRRDWHPDASGGCVRREPATNAAAADSTM